MRYYIGNCHQNYQILYKYQVLSFSLYCLWVYSYLCYLSLTQMPQVKEIHCFADLSAGKGLTPGTHYRVDDRSYDSNFLSKRIFFLPILYLSLHTLSSLVYLLSPNMSFSFSLSRLSYKQHQYSLILVLLLTNGDLGEIKFNVLSITFI